MAGVRFGPKGVGGIVSKFISGVVAGIGSKFINGGPLGIADGGSIVDDDVGGSGGGREPG